MPSIELAISLDGERERARYVPYRQLANEPLPSFVSTTYPLYHDGESVSGKVCPMKSMLC